MEATFKLLPNQAATQTLSQEEAKRVLGNAAASAGFEGLSTTATSAQITKAYRQHAADTRPKRSPVPVLDLSTTALTPTPVTNTK